MRCLRVQAGQNKLGQKNKSVILSQSSQPILTIPLEAIAVRPESTSAFPSQYREARFNVPLLKPLQSGQNQLIQLQAITVMPKPTLKPIQSGQNKLITLKAIPFMSI
jgi:hypothetical protein